MRKSLISAGLLVLLLISPLMVLCASVHSPEPAVSNGEYITVVEGYDWGAAVNKVILKTDREVTAVDKDNFIVRVERSSDCGEMPAERAKGERQVVHAYVSDAEGKYTGQGNHITLVLSVAPNLPLGSPVEYMRGEKCRGNVWIDYRMLIVDLSDGSVWNREAGRIMPLIDKFDLTGLFTHKDINLTYASYKPVTKNAKSPLIIWLHGGGEGGTDPTIPLLANRAANYASDEIQFYFDGAYVLVPQCPTRWMDAGNDRSTRGAEDDIYAEALFALFEDFIKTNPGVDRKRIYVGGCSNGGYMSFELIIQKPAYFAAGYISALAYSGEFLTDEQVKSIKNVPVWFVHSADDGTTVPDVTVLPVYKKLIDAGAKNVHLSYYDNVIDITGFYGGEGYHYPGHWSWVYCHANECRYDFDGSPVRVNGKPVTIMEWMAAQSK